MHCYIYGFYSHSSKVKIFKKQLINLGMHTVLTWKCEHCSYKWANNETVEVGKITWDAQF